MHSRRTYKCQPRDRPIGDVNDQRRSMPEVNSRKTNITNFACQTERRLHANKGPRSPAGRDRKINTRSQLLTRRTIVNLEFNPQCQRKANILDRKCLRVNTWAKYVREYKNRPPGSPDERPSQEDSEFWKSARSAETEPGGQKVAARSESPGSEFWRRASFGSESWQRVWRRSSV